MMAKDANDVHRELGIDGLRELGDSLSDLDFRGMLPKAEGKSAPAEQWTELGNAHRLVRRHGDDVRYVHPLKAWFIWDGVFWRRDDSGEIMRRAEATIEAIFDEAKEIAAEDIRTAFRKFALKSQSNTQLRAMTQLAQHNLQVVLPPAALDADPMLLGVLNGTIALKTCTFHGAQVLREVLRLPKRSPSQKHLKAQGLRRGHRVRGLMGTFGPVAQTMPRHGSFPRAE